MAEPLVVFVEQHDVADKREVVFHQRADRFADAFAHHRIQQIDIQRAGQGRDVWYISQDAARGRPQQAYAAVAARYRVLAIDLAFHGPTDPTLPRVEIDERLARQVPDVHATGAHVGFHGRGAWIGPVEHFVVPGRVVL